MNDPSSRASYSPTDIGRLIQHVALNQSEWWNDAVERLVIACTYKLGQATEFEIRSAVANSCGIDHNSSLLTTAIADLITAGAIVQFGEDLRLSEETHLQSQEHERLTLDAESRARRRFDDMAVSRNLGFRSDELWSLLETEVVLPMVEHMGAQMYGLLGSRTSDDRGDFDEPLAERIAQYSESVRSLFADFLDPSDGDIRQFVLRRLNAQYAIDAAALPKSSLDKLTHLGERAGRIDVFLDTNVVFSVLGLHENPGDDVAVRLVRLAEELKDTIDLRLYVLPETVEETRRTLRAIVHSLSDFRGQPNLAEAATRTRLYGLASAYFEAAKRSPQLLTADDYFGPYESDLVSILRQRSIELYNTDLSPLHVDQEVLDDMHELEERQSFRPQGSKPYAANLHDMVLWHFVKSRRSSRVESPLDAKAWIVTLDYGLLRFDRDRQIEVGRPAVCLLPSSLIQFFQFWVPSVAQLDEALVGSVRQPLLFLEYDRQAEEVTLRILRQISRFSDAEDLDPDLVTEILTNEALRNRLSETREGTAGRRKVASDITDDSHIVEEGMMTILASLQADVSELTQERDGQAGEISDLRDQLEKSVPRSDLETETVARTEAVRHLQEVESDRDRIREEYAALKETASLLESRVESIEDAERMRRSRRERLAGATRQVLIVVAVVIPALAFALVVGMILAQGLWPALRWSSSVVAGALVLVHGLEIAAKHSRFGTQSLIRRLLRARNGVWGLVVAVGAALLAEWILEG